MRKILGLMAAVSLLVFVLGAGTALARHKEGHQRPPACDTSKGKAPQNNKHCYPPAESPATEEGRAFGPTFPDATRPPAGPGGITVGMVTLAAAGTMGGVLLALGLRTRFRRKAAPSPS